MKMNEHNINKWREGPGLGENTPIREMITDGSGSIQDRYGMHGGFCTHAPHFFFFFFFLPTLQGGEGRFRALGCYVNVALYRGYRTE